MITAVEVTKKTPPKCYIGVISTKKTHTIQLLVAQPLFYDLLYVFSFWVASSADPKRLYKNTTPFLFVNRSCATNIDYAPAWCCGDPFFLITC